MYNTYNGWKLLGRVVDAGEKGVMRNIYGDFLFHRSQTVKKGRTVTITYDSRGNRIRRVTEYI